MSETLPTPVYGYAGIARGHDAGQGGKRDVYLLDRGGERDGFGTCPATRIPTFAGLRLQALTDANAAAVAPFIAPRHSLYALTVRDAANWIARVLGGSRRHDVKFCREFINAVAAADAELLADPIFAGALAHATAIVQVSDRERASRPPIELTGYR